MQHGDFFFKFQVVTLALLQLPAICLAVVGLIKAAMTSKGRISTTCKALTIPFVPFFLLGFFNDILMIGGQQCVKQGLSCCNFFSFLGETDGQQSLAFHMTRVFSSSVLQLLFQLVLLLAFTPWHSILPTQILSILASLVMILKVTTELIIFAEGENNQRKKNFCQQFQEFLAKKFHLLKNFLKILPLLLTNIIFNMGTIVLCFSVLDLSFSVCYLGAGFLLHFVLINLLPLLLFTRIGRRLFRIERDIRKKELRQNFLPNLVLSWTNLFILSCSLTKRKFELATTVLLLQVVTLYLSFYLLIQVVRFLTNSGLLIFILATHLETNPVEIGILTGSLLIVGLLSIFLLCKVSLFKVTSNNSIDSRKTKNSIQ